MLFKIWQFVALARLEHEAVFLHELGGVVPLVEGGDEVGAHDEGEVVFGVLLFELFHEKESWYRLSVLNLDIINSYRKGRWMAKQILHRRLEHGQSVMRRRNVRLVGSEAAGDEPDFIECELVEGFSRHL